MHLNQTPSEINDLASHGSTRNIPIDLAATHIEAKSSSGSYLAQADRVLRTVVGKLRCFIKSTISAGKDFYEFSEPVKGYRIRHIPCEEITSEEMEALGLS